jgi:uncharacterized protein YfdQ (DUF2303 family)|tara:strand:- start:317 stop:604 length:288 start_codon:yes stop_codon:yes gene_type:complete
MTVLEIMERTGMTETNITIALIKDAITLLQSQMDENITDWIADINAVSDGDDNIYPFPANMIRLYSISVKDTNEDKYKKIRRLAGSMTLVEDISP